MKELKLLQSMGYEFWIDDGELKYKTTNREQNQDNIRKLLMKLKKHNGLVRYLLEKGLTNDNPKVVAVDIETNSDEIVMVSWCDINGAYTTQNLDEIAELLQNRDIRKVFHNAQFDVTRLERSGYSVNNYFDTMVMSQIIHNRARSENSLKDCAKEFLGIIMDKRLQSENNWNGEITEEHIEYCKNDSVITYQLYMKLASKIEDLHLEEVMYREMFALPAIIELSKNGIIFDINGWANELSRISEEKDAIEESIKEFFNDKDININSPEQLKQALNSSGIEVDGTADEVLAKKEGDHSIITSIRKYKKLKAVLTKYGKKLKDALNNNRIYSDWRLIGTDTGRMSCKNVNLQGFPKNAKKYFKPSNGNKFIVADYSQIELRILAEISCDQTMIDCIKAGIDLHRKTASAIVDKQIDEITDIERKIAKTINFGIVYGMTAYGIRNRIKAQCNIDISLQEAEEFRNSYFSLYPNILKFQDRMLKSDCIATLGGRYWSKETIELEKGKIQRFNYPIQASAAEGFKEALKLLMDRKRSNWRIAVVVHDEIVLEAPDDEIEEASNILKDSMIEGMQKLIKDVPIEVDINIGDYWIK